MCTEYDGVSALQTNLTLADLWLEGMAHGASHAGLSVQYCMPYPNDILAGSQHVAVTNARATGDYFHALNQWAIGGTAMLYWALGILPFKDGFYSSTAKQVGGQTVGPETHPDREALMSVLSTAMVAPMDGIHLLNATRVNATCRADGIVLKPDRPSLPRGHVLCGQRSGLLCVPHVHRCAWAGARTLSLREQPVAAAHAGDALVTRA